MADLGELEKQAFKELLRKEKQYERRIALVFRDALTVMRGEMSRIYEKYAKDGVLTKVEMTRYNRYATMEKQMLSILDPAVRSTVREIKRLTPEQYGESFFRYAWAIDNAAGVRLAWGLLNKDVVLAELANEFTTIALDRYGPEARLAIRTALNNGLSLGKSYTQMARDLKKAINTSNFKALRILRTEGQYAINAGQSDAYLRAKEKGINGVEKWDATLDGRTRPTHQAMDGQIRQEDGFFDGPGSERAPYPAWEGLSAAERIQCRCTLRFEIEGYEPALRRSREDGLIPYQTYPEWAKNRKTFK